MSGRLTADERTRLQMFASALSEVLAANGLSYLALARKLNVEAKSAHRWTHAKRRPSVDMLARIERVAATSPDDSLRLHSAYHGMTPEAYIGLLGAA